VGVGSLKPPYAFVCIVNIKMYDSPDIVIQRTKIWSVWRPQVGRKNLWRLLADAAFEQLHMHGAVSSTLSW